METQQAEPYAGVAVPVNDPSPVAPVPYTGAEPVAPAQVVAQESLPYAGSGSVMRIQLADGRILEVAVPPGTPPGHQIHFPVAAAPPTQLAPAPQPPMARAGAPAKPPPPPVSAPETLTIQVPPGAIPGSVCRIGLTDGRHLDITVPAGVQPGTQFTIPVPPGNVGAGVASVYAPETVTIQVPPGAIPGSVFRIKLTDGRDLDVTVPHGFPPGAPLTIPVPPRPVDRHGRPLAGIKKKSTATCFGPCCAPSLGCPGECKCCPTCVCVLQLCFFIFCCPFAMLAACNGNL